MAHLIPLVGKCNLVQRPAQFVQLIILMRGPERGHILIQSQYGLYLVESKPFDAYAALVEHEGKEPGSHFVSGALRSLLLARRGVNL